MIRSRTRQPQTTHHIIPPCHRITRHQKSKKALKSSDHTSNPKSATKGPARNPRHALATDRKKISIHQIAAQNHHRANRKTEWKGDIAELDLTSCSASGRHCISCSICASRPPQPPLSTFMGSIAPPPSAIRGRSSSSSSSPAARRERERGVRLTAGEKIGEGGRERESTGRKATCQVGPPAPHMDPPAPCRVRSGKWLGNYASAADRLVGEWVHAVSWREYCGRQATWSGDRRGSPAACRIARGYSSNQQTMQQRL
jgi:hypothetical protein